MSSKFLHAIPGLAAVAVVGTLYHALAGGGGPQEPAFEAECRDGYRWRLFRTDGGNGAAATFSSCAPGDDYISMSCQAGSDQVVILINRRFRGLQDGTPVTAEMTIGERVHRLRGMAAFDDRLSGTGVVLATTRGDTVFGSLTRSGEGALSVAGEEIPFHTHGSFHPVLKMIEACGGYSPPVRSDKPGGQARRPAHDPPPS